MGLFQKDVAVSTDPSSWSVFLTVCGPAPGKKDAKSCRTVDIPPPGAQSSDGCHPDVTRVAPTGKDRLDKPHYLAKVDMRRCSAERPANSVKPRVVAVRRSRRQAVRAKL